MCGNIGIVKGVPKMAKSKNKVKTTAEIYQSIRRDWGSVNPVTKIIPNKKKSKRYPKHKGKLYENTWQSSWLVLYYKYSKGLLWWKKD